MYKFERLLWDSEAGCLRTRGEELQDRGMAEILYECVKHSDIRDMPEAAVEDKNRLWAIGLYRKEGADWYLLRWHAREFHGHAPGESLWAFNQDSASSDPTGYCHTWTLERLCRSRVEGWKEWLGPV